MTDAEILEQLTEIFREIFRDNRLVVTPAMTAKDVERWDSLSHIDMMVMVEEAFKVRFRTREVSGLANVGELVSLIQANQR